MSKKDIDRMDRLLADGWRNPGGLVPGDDWKAGVMAEIRSTPAEAPVTNGFSRVVLRVSIAAAAASLALVAWTLSTGMIPYEEIAMMLLEDPVSMLSSPFVIV
jgi:hypothetical protein